LHVGEAEVVGDVGDGTAELVREVDLLVVGELFLPEVAVGLALIEAWVGKEVLSVESGRTFLFRVRI